MLRNRALQIDIYLLTYLLTYLMMPVGLKSNVGYLHWNLLSIFCEAVLKLKMPYARNNIRVRWADKLTISGRSKFLLINRRKRLYKNVGSFVMFI